MLLYNDSQHHNTTTPQHLPSHILFPCLQLLNNTSMCDTYAATTHALHAFVEATSSFRGRTQKKNWGSAQIRGNDRRCADDFAALSSRAPLSFFPFAFHFCFFRATPPLPSSQSLGSEHAPSGSQRDATAKPDLGSERSTGRCVRCYRLLGAAACGRYHHCLITTILRRLGSFYTRGYRVAAGVQLLR